MRMAFNSRAFLFLVLYTLVWNLACISFSSSSDQDIACLRVIKESLEDPFNRLTWVFDNLTADFFCNLIGVSCWNKVENRVFGIELSNMGLRGQFPRGIRNCTSLVRLDLSGNHLSGPIPEDIATLVRFLVTLDLSKNEFSGEIPKNLANITYLNILLLHNNQLTGRIPSELGELERIKRFDVSNNLLNGPVPLFYTASISKENYVNNIGLCGEPLRPCADQGHGLKFDYTIKSGFMVGYVISTVLAASVFISFSVPSWESEKRGKKMTIERLRIFKMIMSKYNTTAPYQPSPPPRPRPSRDNKIIEADQLIQEILILEKLITRMSLADFRKATKNFSEDNVIGMGQIGTMYKATLSSGQFLAVKKLYDSQYLDEQFIFELKTLVRLGQYDNIVQLQGFCVESKERLLAYEYLSNGNLYDWLHPADGEPSCTMEWPLRLKIATGVARGLAWLHHQFGIVHLDISSKCILLDKNFEPKLSNFGQAMYLNPNDDTEFWQLDFIQEDVHGFGLLLLELITGKEANEIGDSLSSYDGTLVEWIAHLSESSYMLLNAIDESLIGRGFDGEIFQFLKVACQCVQPFADQRPTMLELYKTFSAVWERYGLVGTSEAMMPDEISAASARGECIEDEITESP